MLEEIMKELDDACIDKEGNKTYGNNRKNDYRRISWGRSVRRRDGQQCQCCGSFKRPQAHHIFSYTRYVNKRYKLSNGITLCSDCHAAFHINFGRYNNNRKQLREFLATRKIDNTKYIRLTSAQLYCRKFHR